MAPLGACGRLAQQRAQIVAIEHVVAEDQRGRPAGKEFLADQEGFRDAAGMILHRVGKLDAPLPAVAEQALELVDFLRRGDDQEFADARQHQRGQRIVDQRLVIDRQQLLRGRERQRIQPRAAAACQNDPLAIHASNSSSRGRCGGPGGFVSMRDGIDKCFSATNPVSAMVYEPNPRSSRKRLMAAWTIPVPFPKPCLRRIGWHCLGRTSKRNDIAQMTRRVPLNDLVRQNRSDPR